MSNNHTTLEVINETPKESLRVNDSLNPGLVDMIFGKPNSPKNNATGVHFINNERKPETHLDNNNHKPNHDADSEQPSQPLLEPDRDKQKPPLAGPEIDDLDDEAEKPNDHTPYPGIDDGLLEPGGTDKHHEGEDGPDEHSDKDGDHSLHDEGAGTEDGKWPWTSDGDEPDFPYDGVNGLGTRFGVDDRPVSPFPGSTPDVNTYQQKKNLAQGMMDLALLSANANQLRYVLESSTTHPYYYSSLTLISLSIIFQIAVGVGLILNSRYDVNDKNEIHKADKINNMTVLGVFMITIVNVFIASFSVASSTTVTNTVQQAG